MHARVSVYSGSAERADDLVRAFEATPLRDLPGVKEAVLLLDRSSGKAITITYWESEDAMRASAEGANRMRSQAMDASGGSVASVETFEGAMRETF